jgi:hypothetical protein
MAKRPWWTLAVLVVICALVVGASYFFSDAASRTEIRMEVAKIFLQLGVIGILGVFAKWIFDEYSSVRDRDRDRASALNAFRKDVLGRLIRVTNRVRRVPILIAAAQSARTYGEQMRWLVNSRLELSFIRHDIATVKEAFSEKYEKIVVNIQKMEEYLDELITEFTTENPKLSSKLIRPARDGGRRLGEEVWNANLTLNMLKDLSQPDQKGSRYYANYVLNYSAARDDIRQEIWSTSGVKSKQTKPPESTENCSSPEKTDT